MTYKSESSHAVLNKESRQAKAKKISQLLLDQSLLKGARVLDVGTGSGDIAEQLAIHADHVTSLDVVDERQAKKGFSFKLVADEVIPFDDASFDIVISNQVIEHVPDHTTHINEMYRVLKPGGAIYLATPNRFWLTDPHHKLWFIGWMPRQLANRYMMIARNREWDIFPASYVELLMLTRGKLNLNSQTDVVLGNPDRYGFKLSGITKVVSWVVPGFIWKLATPFLPSFIFLGRKRSDQ